jgi:lactate permease
MNYILASSPILLLFVLLTVFKWSGRKAGIISWLFSLGIAGLFFGLSLQVLWVSQIKGIIFSIYVLLVLWTALLLYNLNFRIGGISALTTWLEGIIPDPSLLKIILAWAFSAVLEGIAGFGLPIAVAAPMLAGLGVPPIQTVVASAIGHTWSVTLGNMGMVFQVLTSISEVEEAALIPTVALMMGLACVLCGIAVAVVLGLGSRLTRDRATSRMVGHADRKQWRSLLCFQQCSRRYRFAVLGRITLWALLY